MTLVCACQLCRCEVDETGACGIPATPDTCMCSMEWTEFSKHCPHFCKCYNVCDHKDNKVICNEEDCPILKE